MSHSDQTVHPPETWAPVRRAAAAIASPIHRILAIEAASGVVLLVSTAVALVWANIFTASYQDLWHTPVGARLGSWSFEHPLYFWINEGLMTVFFFVVGLEIRRELFEGELATIRKAALPLAAAVGGMLIPAALFSALNHGRAGAAGWAVPMATDIAFAVGVLTILGSRVPPPLRVLLLGLAVIDDIGAIVVIAIFYSDGISPVGFVVLAAGLALIMTMRAAGVRTPLLYVAPGVTVWLGLLMAGVHPTLAGVMIGLLTPVRPWFGASGFAETTQAHLNDLHAHDRSSLLSTLDRVGLARREAVSPVERLIHVLHPWVAFAVLPLFALVNAGVVLGGASVSGDHLWLFLGIVLGLAVGKPLGIAAAGLGATKLRLATRTDDVTPRGVGLVGFVGGIGFTMSIFIAALAFPEGPMLDTAKLAILVGSGIAIVVGLLFGLVHQRGRG